MPTALPRSDYAAMFGLTTGDLPVQICSHSHFAETNLVHSLDSDAARRMSLDIADGTAVRFEPGQTREVQLTSYAGTRRVFGFNQRVIGEL